MRRVVPILLLLAAAVPARAEWRPEGNVFGYGGNQSTEQICRDESGGALIAWLDNATLPQRIRLTRVLADGSLASGWPANGLRIAGTIGPVSAPALASDGAGGAFVIWRDERSGTSVDLYAQHVLADGSLAPGWPQYGLPVSTGPGTPSRYEYRIIADGQDGMIAVWVEEHLAPDPLTTGIYALRMNSDGTLPAGWSAGGKFVVMADRETAVVTDGAGGVLIAWQQFGATTYYDIWMQRVLADGSISPDWPSTGFGAVVAPGHQDFYDFVSDGDGGAFIAIRDTRHLFYVGDVYAQHVTGSAQFAAGWSAAGQPVAVWAGEQFRVRVVPDAAGGAIFVWQDERANADIYAQRLDAAGTTLWTFPSGIPVCTDPNYQQHPAVVGDGAGGVIVSWADARVSGNGVYATHLDPAGNVVSGWTDGGSTVTQPTSYGAPRMVSDGTGGAIIAWYTGNIVAAHIESQGQVAVYASLVSAEAEPEFVRIRWYGAHARGEAATVQRSEPGSGWIAIAEAAFDPTGHVAVEDRTVTPGARYGYRLRLLENGREYFTGETPIEVPRVPAFAIARVTPNPASGPFRVELSLPGREPATLQLLDLAGRRIEAREVGGLGRGVHTVTFGEVAPLAPGVYRLRLTHGGESRVKAIAIVR